MCILQFFYVLKAVTHLRTDVRNDSFAHQMRDGEHG